MDSRATDQKDERSAVAAGLLMAMELSKKQWKLAFHDGSTRKPRLVTARAGEWPAIEFAIAKAKRAFGVDAKATVRSCYEAGREGFSVHRKLTQLGVENVVIDAGSLEVVRRRHAKTDRLDALGLVDRLLTHLQGRRAFSVVRVPSVDAEATRLLDRERETLKMERGQHATRIRNFLFAQGIVMDECIKPEKLRARMPQMRTSDGRELSACLRMRIERELERYELTNVQLKKLDDEREAQLVKGDDEQAKKVQQLITLKGIGETSAIALVVEMFGWRHFANRRQLGSALGLTPTPFASGQMRREQGISKSGNKRCRALLVELAWLWMRYQPTSKIARWYAERFGGDGSRPRRVGIVAVARKLAIALWQYLEQGLVPEGAMLKAA